MNSAIEQHFHRQIEGLSSDEVIVDLTPATRLLTLRHEMSDVDSTLQDKRQAFYKKMDNLKERRQELDRKEFKLRESLCKFDKFLQENDSKRVKAIKKAGDDRDMTKIKESEIEKLENELSIVERQSSRLRKQVTNHKTYQTFMNQVLDASHGDFQEIREITGRYHTLVSTREDLLELHNKHEENLKETKRFFSRFLEDKDIEILCCNLQLSKLQRKLDETKHVADQKEAEWLNISSASSNKTFLLGKIIMTTNNLHLLIEKAKRERRSHNMDSDLSNIQERLSTSQKLAKIQEHIKDMTDIIREKKLREIADSRSSQANQKI